MDDSSVQLIKGSGTLLLYDNKNLATGYYQPETRDRNSLMRERDGDWVETQPDGFRLYYALPPSSSTGSSVSVSSGHASASGSASASGDSASVSGSNGLTSVSSVSASGSALESGSGGSLFGSGTSGSGVSQTRSGDTSGASGSSPPPPPPPPPPSGWEGASESSSSESSSSSSSSESGSESSGGGVLTHCCPNPIPTTLKGTLSNRTGGCTCLPSEITFAYSGSIAQDTYWQQSVGACGSTFDLTLQCAEINDGAFWNLTSTHCFGAVDNPTSVSCDPFVLTFTGLTCAGLCSGTFDLTITE